jgi:adenylosuccinate synthase
MLFSAHTNQLGVVHIPSFFKELAALKEKDIKYEDRLFLSDRGELDRTSYLLDSH